MMLRMRKVKMLIFDTPPIKNQGFWLPREAKMEPKFNSQSIFIAIESDTWKMTVFRKGCGRLAPAQARLLESPAGVGPRQNANYSRIVERGAQN